MPPQIAHETIDGETFIINTFNGLYFVAKEYASMIWNAIHAGYSSMQIQQAFEAQGIKTVEPRHLEHFFSVLLNEELISPVEHDLSEPTSPLVIEKNENFMAPVLSIYDDLKELVQLDPIHEVSEHDGWPFQKESVES